MSEEDKRARDSTFTTLGTAMTQVTRAAQAVAKGESTLRTNPGRGPDVLADGRSRLNIICKPFERHEREPIVWQAVVAEYEKGEALCESPIERMMLASLLTADWSYFGVEFPLVVDLRQSSAFIPPDASLAIIPQLTIARYRCDFALVMKRGITWRCIAVECDGAEFHDARRDQGRDFNLACLGIQTVRFSGQRINTEPLAIGNEIAEGLPHWWRD